MIFLFFCVSVCTSGFVPVTRQFSDSESQFWHSFQRRPSSGVHFPINRTTAIYNFSAYFYKYIQPRAFFKQMYMYTCNLATKIDVCHAKSLGSYITLYSTAEYFSPISLPPACMGEIFLSYKYFHRVLMIDQKIWQALPQLLAKFNYFKKMLFL